MSGVGGKLGGKAGERIKKASRALLFGAITLASLGYVLVWALPR